MGKITYSQREPAGALRPWQREEYVQFSTWLAAEIRERLNVKADEAAAVVQVLVCLSAWRDDIETMDVQVLRLEQSARCNGTEEWRNGHETLYMRHRVDQTCPLHGAPSQPGKRIVKYIGVKDENITKVEAAVARQQEYEEAAVARQRLRRNVSFVKGKLIEIAARL